MFALRNRLRGREIADGICRVWGRGYFDNVVVRLVFVRFAVFGVLQQDFVHVRARVLKKFARRIEDDQGDFAVAQDAQFVRFLHQAELAFRKRYL